MKAIILAAGKGTRMLPLTEDMPKVLIEVNGKPFLYHLIENLRKAGFEEYGIVAGYKIEKIREFVEKNSINAEIIEQKEQLGTGDAVKLTKEFIGDENFIVLYGDNLYSEKDIEAVKKDDSQSYIIGKKVSNPEKYGVLVIDDKTDRLKKIVEKPEEFVGDIINTGLYKFTPEIFDAIENIQTSERGEYELTDAISILAEKGKVSVIQLKDYWLDFGCIEDIKKVEYFLNKQFLINSK